MIDILLTTLVLNITGISAVYNDTVHRVSMFILGKIGNALKITYCSRLRSFKDGHISGTLFNSGHARILYSISYTLIMPYLIVFNIYHHRRV